MSEQRVHAFTDDALGEHDAVALAEQVRTGQVSPAELVTAAHERLERIESRLHTVAVPMFDAPRSDGNKSAALFGVPTVLKDNTDLRGLPTNHGSEAFTARPAKRDGFYATQYLATGLTIVGKSRLPEFGFNATTEYMTNEPVRNPWETGHSIGASSGGSAALDPSWMRACAVATSTNGTCRSSQ